MVGEGDILSKSLRVRKDLWYNSHAMAAELKLSANLKEALVRCLRNRPEIHFAILYGSAAEGRSFRDLDIGLWVDRASVPVLSELDYSFALADELEQVAPCAVDVRVINDAPLPFRYNVSKGIPLVINHKEAFYHFLERTWDDFLDFEPVAMQYLRDLG
jgi:predicted nucleotidyltransferase